LVAAVSRWPPLVAKRERVYLAGMGNRTSDYAWAATPDSSRTKPPRSSCVAKELRLLVEIIERVVDPPKPAPLLRLMTITVRAFQHPRIASKDRASCVGARGGIGPVVRAVINATSVCGT